jgi:glycosyltransferase involved in cell wall biosynthesis
LNISLNMGGAEKLMVEFARHADPKLFELRFITLGERGILADEIESCGWPVTALNEPEGLRKWLVFRLAWLFHSWNTDVVHIHNSKALFYGGPAAKLARTAAVLHTRHGQRFESTVSDNLVFRLLTQLVHRVVCVSQDSARLSAAEGIAPARIRTIWNGIDVHRFAYVGPCARGPAVMVGRLSWEKDVATLVRATTLAAKQCPDFCLEIAGDGDCLPELRDLASELGVNGQVKFLGEVRDIPALLARSSLLVLPSLTEGISLTLLEAMARGLPVVATRVGGNPEVVIDGQTGYLVPAQRPEAMAERMVELFRQEKLAQTMGQRGRERVMGHFRAAQMVGRYEALYHEILNGRKSGIC